MSGLASGTVSFGIVVSDIDKAVAFYRDALGMAEAYQFDVPASMGGDSGLSDHKPFRVHVMQASDEPTATSVKLMQFPDAPGARPDNAFIHSSYGVRYLTVMVDDIDAAVARATRAGAPPLARGPIALPADLAEGAYLACVRDPDGNMIELLGPKAS